MPSVADLRELRDIPRVPEGATPEQAAAWMEEQLGLTLATAEELLAPYWGSVGRYLQELGTIGEYALWLCANASVSTAAEGMGYASASGLSERWKAQGLPVARRSMNPDPFGNADERFEGGLDADALLDYYTRATGVRENALDYTGPKAVVVDGEWLTISLIADTHLGPRSCDLRRLRAWIDWMQTAPDTRWAHLGDWEGLGKAGPSTASDPEILSWEQVQVVKRRLFSGIAPRNLWCLTGNHDRRVAKIVGIDYDPVQAFCKELRMAYAGYERFVRIEVTDGKDTSQEYGIYVHHGKGGGRSEGYALKQAAEFARANRADAVAIGHLHREEIGTIGQRVIAADGGIMPEYCRLLAVSSFQRHIGGTYSANIGTGPRPLGATNIRLHLHDHRITIDET